jgi:hypothetical protein
MIRMRDHFTVSPTYRHLIAAPMNARFQIKAGACPGMDKMHGLAA